MIPYYERDGITIYCGDCLEVMPLLHAGSFKLVIADPPYGIEYQSNRRQLKFDFIEGDRSYPSDWLNDIRRLTDESAALYVFCNDRSFDIARLALHQSKFELKKTLIWDKMNVTAGNLENYGDRVEFILFANKYYKPRLRGSRDGNIISIPRVNPLNLKHPTEKPEFLMGYLVMKSTDPDELVLDPFMGVGTVLAATQQLGRRAIGIEISEDYCRIAVDRLRQPSFFSIPDKPVTIHPEQLPLIG